MDKATENTLNDLNTLKSKVLALALDPQTEITLAQLESVASICKTTSEAGKDIKSLRSEAVRFWVPILAPFATVIVLVAGFLLQYQQFQSSVNQQTNTLKAQIEVNEDTGWRETIKMMADRSGGINSAAGVAMLKSYLTSEKHGREARELALVLLGHMVKFEGFKQLFYDVIRPNSSADFNDVVQINRGLESLYSDFYYEQKQNEQDAKSRHTPKISQQLQHSARYLNDAMLDSGEDEISGVLDDIEREEEVTTDAIEAMIKAGIIAKTELDLSDTYLIHADFSNANLSSAKFTNVGLYDINLDNTDLSDLVVPSVYYCAKTAWWRASKVSAPLLETLVEKFPWSPSKNDDQHIGNKDEYDRNISRLRLQLNSQ